MLSERDNSLADKSSASFLLGLIVYGYVGYNLEHVCYAEMGTGLGFNNGGLRLGLVEDCMERAARIAAERCCWVEDIFGAFG